MSTRTLAYLLSTALLSLTLILSQSPVYFPVGLAAFWPGVVIGWMARQMGRKGVVGR